MGGVSCTRIVLGVQYRSCLVQAGWPLADSFVLMFLSKLQYYPFTLVGLIPTYSQQFSLQTCCNPYLPCRCAAAPWGSDNPHCTASSLPPTLCSEPLSLFTFTALLPDHHPTQQPRIYQLLSHSCYQRTPIINCFNDKSVWRHFLGSKRQFWAGILVSVYVGG